MHIEGTTLPKMKKSFLGLLPLWEVFSVLGLSSFAQLLCLNDALAAQHAVARALMTAAHVFQICCSCALVSPGQ